MKSLMYFKRSTAVTYVGYLNNKNAIKTSRKTFSQFHVFIKGSS